MNSIRCRLKRSFQAPEDRGSKRRERSASARISGVSASGPAGSLLEQPPDGFGDVGPLLDGAVASFFVVVVGEEQPGEPTGRQFRLGQRRVGIALDPCQFRMLACGKGQADEWGRSGCHGASPFRSFHQVCSRGAT